jgi:hypothetical protein
MHRGLRASNPTCVPEPGLSAQGGRLIATVHAKCAGIAEEDASRAPLPGSPLTTVSGLVSHLRRVEYSWFEVVLLGGENRGPWTDEDPTAASRPGGAGVGCSRTS